MGSFQTNDLIEQPYGLAYDIVDKRLKVVPVRSLQEVGKNSSFITSRVLALLSFPEDTDATNELINDGQFVQPLTLEEIEALKKSGVHAQVDIVANHLCHRFAYPLLRK